MHSNVEENAGQILALAGISQRAPDGATVVTVAGSLKVDDPVWQLEPEDGDLRSFSDQLRGRQDVRCKIKMAFSGCRHGLTGHERINARSCRIIAHSLRGTDRDEPIWCLEPSPQHEGWFHIKMVSNIEGQRGYMLTARDNENERDDFHAAVSSSNVVSADTLWQFERVDDCGEDYFRIRRGPYAYLTTGALRNGSSFHAVVAPLRSKPDAEEAQEKIQSTAWELVPSKSPRPNSYQIRLADSSGIPLYLSGNVPRNGGSMRVVAQADPGLASIWQLERPTGLDDPYWHIRLVKPECPAVPPEQRGTQDGNADGYGLTTHERTLSDDGLLACLVIAHRLRNGVAGRRDLPIWRIEDVMFRVVTCCLLESPPGSPPCVQCANLAGSELTTLEVSDTDTVLTLRLALAAHLGEYASRLRLLGLSQDLLQDNENAINALTV